MFLTHIKSCWAKLLGNPELDKRFIGVPHYAGNRHFSSGLSPLTQWTGNEAKAAAKVFLPVVAGNGPHLAVRAVRCVIDCMYRARQPQLDEDNLASLGSDLSELHTCKGLFVARRVHVLKYGFNKFAKLHMLRHYPHLIREWGTPDGYNTEGPEQMHINYVKVNYLGTNGVNAELQMLVNLQRTEALGIQRAKLERAGVLPKRQHRYRLDGEPTDWEDESNDKDGHQDDSNIASSGQLTTCVKEESAYQPKPSIRIAKRPTFLNVKGTTIIANHHAESFIRAV